MGLSDTLVPIHSISLSTLVLLFGPIRFCLVLAPRKKKYTMQIASEQLRQIIPGARQTWWRRSALIVTRLGLWCPSYVLEYVRTRY